MYQYNFERLYDNDYGWLINNRSKINESGNMISLMSQILTLFPSNKFTITCSGNLASVYFETELTSQEQTDLTSLVADYQTIIPVE